MSVESDVSVWCLFHTVTSKTREEDIVEERSSHSSEGETDRDLKDEEEESPPTRLQQYSATARVWHATKSNMHEMLCVIVLLCMCSAQPAGPASVRTLGIIIGQLRTVGTLGTEGTLRNGRKSWNTGKSSPHCTYAQ